MSKPVTKTRLVLTGLGNAVFGAVLGFTFAMVGFGGVWTGVTLLTATDTRPCAAALRVGMGDSGAAEVAAITSPACASLSDEELADTRARVSARLIRESAG